MSGFRLLLLPFALVYDFVTRIRNRMYDTGWKPSVKFDLPVISVGNLSVGGTGKTPMVEYLIRLISPTQKVATLSRGYGRRTKGFRVVKANDNPTTVGDEPFQLYTKYKDRIVVSVGEERAYAIPLLLDQFDDTQVVLLDDAFQHRRVKPGFSILLSEFNKPFYSDYVMPHGRLREHARGAQRADAIVLTKCPDELDDNSMRNVRSRIQKFSKKPVFFTRIHYGKPVPFHTHTFMNRVVLVTGIANHKPLEEYIAANFTLIKHFSFRDHHHYTSEDLQLIQRFVQQQNESVSIITTEKDSVKLKSESLKSSVSTLPFFSLPIEMDFIINGKDFDTMVLEFIARD